MRALYQRANVAVARAVELRKESLGLMERAHRLAHDARNSCYEAEILRAKARMDENRVHRDVTSGLRPERVTRP